MEWQSRSDLHEEPFFAWQHQDKVAEAMHILIVKQKRTLRSVISMGGSSASPRAATFGPEAAVPSLLRGDCIMGSPSPPSPMDASDMSMLLPLVLKPAGDAGVLKSMCRFFCTPPY